jgi:hypothetical protein
LWRERTSPWLTTTHEPLSIQIVPEPTANELLTLEVNGRHVGLSWSWQHPPSSYPRPIRSQKCLIPLLVAELRTVGLPSGFTTDLQQLVVSYTAKDAEIPWR